jgi:hypothetical protein
MTARAAIRAIPGKTYLIFAVGVLLLISTLKVADRQLLAPLYARLELVARLALPRWSPCRYVTTPPERFATRVPPA